MNLFLLLQPTVAATDIPRFSHAFSWCCAEQQRPGTKPLAGQIHNWMNRLAMWWLLAGQLGDKWFGGHCSHLELAQL